MLLSIHTRRRASAATLIAAIGVTTSVAIGGASTTYAQSPDREMLPKDAIALQGSEASSNGTSNKKALVGSWLETVTFPAETGRPPVKSLVSFHADGTMVASDQGGVTLEPPSVFSSGHGVWTPLKKRTSAYSVLYMISDLNGNLVGYLKVRGVFTVSQSGNEYNGTSFAQVLDTDGNILFSVEVTNTAQRIQIELP
jgi:hypothetical protein